MARIKTYIAGPMTGIVKLNRPAFRAMAIQLKQNLGRVVLNPATLPCGLTQAEYMDICLAMIRSADTVFLLQGWEQSEGAVAEYHYAKKIGKIIEYQGAQA
ncbi:MAG: DUF4406 domain-containing protein [Desulfomicrobium sp.]|nr:DUF4406 domain-containing protein [Desulfomicrobium sp.]